MARTITDCAASTLARKRRDLERQLTALLAASTGCDLARQLQAKIGRARDQLLTFCDYPGQVDATNNTSERKLRPCVIQRKVTCHLIFAPDRVDAIDSNKAARSYFELALEGNAQANNLLSSLCLDASRAASSTLSTLGSFR